MCIRDRDCILKKRIPLTDGYSGLRVVSILEAASKSLKSSGKSIQIKNQKVMSKNMSNLKN